ncbi:TonB-dependent receptor [Neoasaia chiangmaiensis NBRC 101099]|uniref:TonB-dependent receptor n=1 Tax=Neoasaia chiangmaiensis TaxID=320497 RepID=A0A1U9KVB6_9PROT|nr:TonB-dependent receptor [Neoasaia chiangmaiensis]AQS89560.1 TonB-dependent receptor [Neoasaia chiangmaiensis]GBR40556.1 TonB-dependent receptor [Neoasaia chiangmaiensis NBRC 101099]GEN13843.1 TonB-dependent receptor [Neoasaia chiangmaiensis]
MAAAGGRVVPHPAHKKHPLPKAESIEVSGIRRAFTHGAAQHLPDADTRLTAERLTERGVVDLRGLERVAPNLTIQSINGTASTNFYLRGIGFNDFTQNNMGPVLAYFDDVPFAYSTMSSGLMFDMADVTVTPGPVGTQHGQSDSGGEIRLRTNDPTDSFHYGASQDIASYARSRSEAYVSGPIADGLSFRLAGQTRHGGGWQTDPLNGDHLGDADEWALRGKLRWQPDSRTTIMLSGHVVQDNSEVVGAVPIHRLIGGAALPTVGWQQSEWSARPEFTRLIGRKDGLKPSEHNWFWGWDLNVRHDFGPVTLTSISAFETEREGEYTDQDATAAAQADTYRTVNANAFTQELRLSNSHPDDRLQWVIGAFYQHTRMNQRFFFDYTDYVPARGYLQATSFGMDQESTSEFGHVSYRLPKHVTIFGGLLHEIDDRSITGLQSEIFGRSVTNFHAESTAAAQFAGQVGVSWQAARNVLLYYKMSKGFKPGGFTANNTQLQAQLAPFRPETVLTYELGLKSDPIPNRLRINAAAFYNDFHNQQILGTVLIPNYGPLSQLTNAPKSESWGFEGTLDIHPFRHLFLTQNLGWQRGNFQDFPTVNRARTNAYYAKTGMWRAINDNFSGVDNGQPKLTLNGQADWRQALSPRYGLEFGPDWSYRGAQALTPGGTGFYRLPPYFLLGAHMTLRPSNEHWQATIYATNILDRHYYTSGGQATTVYMYIPGAPRFIGGRISCGF